MRKTIEEKVHARKFTRPKKWVYFLFRIISGVQNLLCNTHFIYHARPGDDPRPIVMIANHSTRTDSQYTMVACLPKRLNYVVANNEFYRFPTNILFALGKVIPKKNFTPDMFAMRKILRAAKSGQDLCFMPEGLSSVDGMARPVMLGTGALIKQLGRPVYYSKICGGYMTYSKFCLERRKGRVDVYVEQMFTPEQLAEMTPAEIEDSMNRLLAHDDFIWNEEARVRFRGKGQMAKNLDTLLYRCPKCGAIYRMDCQGNRMTCQSCGNAVELNEYYDLAPIGESVCPERITDWTMEERKCAAEEVRSPDFQYSGHFRIGDLPEYQPLFGGKASVLRGEGDLTLDKVGLHFSGTLGGEPYHFEVPSLALPSVVIPDDLSFFFAYINGKYIQFIPDKNDVYHWQLLIEELHRASGGKWQNTPYRHTTP